MIRTLFLFFLTLALLTHSPLLAVETTVTEEVEEVEEDTTSVKKSDKEDDSTTGADVSLFMEQLHEIMTVLKNKYPAFLQQLDKKQTEKRLNSFLESMGSGLHFSYDQYETRNHQKDKDGVSEVYSAVMIASNRVLYIRIDEFSAKAFGKLQEDLQMSFNLAKKPFGIILDLRNCQGYDIQDAIKSLALICPVEKLPNSEDIGKITQITNIPCTVLVGEQTAGAAEAFIHILKHTRNCLVIGTKTSGDLFPLEKISLKSGGNLCLPIIPKFYQNLSFKAVKPDIEVKAYPQLDYKDISQKSGSEKKDSCLQRATDLLICIHNLKKQ